jgi:chromosomal replication initiation ATPase DnaA
MMIKEAVEEAFPGNGRLARSAGIYLCHRFSGAKLKDIGDLYGISESGVTQAGKRFEETMKKDSSLEKRVVEIARKLSLSIV